MLERLAFLFDRYISRNSSSSEVDELMVMIQDPQHKEMVQLLLDQVIAGTPEEEDMSPEAADAILAAIFSVEEKETGVEEVHHMRSGRWKVWLAAASVLLLLGIGGYFMLNKPITPPVTIARTNNDVPAPANNRAVITLADGSKIYLDSAGNGTIAQQENVNVVKSKEGAISYQIPANSQQLAANSLTNLLYNPRGSQVISLTLSDGTKVWLNSESSLKYPTAFTGNTREVEITGEAYFEVKHDAKQPFKVHLPNGGIVEDLGTEFNINAYTDEPGIKTTLVEGSVRVSTNSQQLTANSLTIKPGQQAVLTNSDQLTANSSADLDAITAWKNGKFLFNNTDIKTIMKQIMRWYDVNVVYESNVEDRYFTADISRNTNLSDLLKALALSGIHFKLEGKTLTVLK